MSEHDARPDPDLAAEDPGDPGAWKAFVEQDPAGSTDLASGARIEYELHDWPIESRQMLRQLLLGVEIPHVWQGGRLVVPEASEAHVDDLVDQVEETTTGTLLDPDAAQVAFEVQEWDDALVGQLTGLLDERSVPWAFAATGELVVLAEHADVVEGLVDELEFPDALPVAGEDDAGQDEEPPEDGTVEIDPDAVLGGLFVACDRLARNAADASGVLAAVRLNTTLASARMPFGYDPKVWQETRSRAAALAVVLEREEADGGSDGDATDEEIEQAAAELRDLLRGWV